MSRIGPISAVTIAAPELQRLIDSYQLYLGYELVDTGRVTHAMATLWGRSGLAGRRYGLMAPKDAGGQFLFRFVESRPAPHYQPFRHFGWNAAELIVQDPDALAARLDESPFRIIGPPADLSFSDKIRAMQVLGPAKEALYLTHIKEKLPGLDTPEAKQPVDRVFIMIVGGESVASLNEFHARHFAVPEARTISAVISVLSNAFGIPPDTKHELAALALQGQSYIEADRMPGATTPRPVESGELPPAISMVSFGVDALPSSGLEYAAPPRTLPEAPYYGRSSAVCVGSAGELIELIER
jgi:hypothetical protein